MFNLFLEQGILRLQFRRQSPGIPAADDDRLAGRRTAVAETNGAGKPAVVDFAAAGRADEPVDEGVDADLVEVVHLGSQTSVPKKAGRLWQW